MESVYLTDSGVWTGKGTGKADSLFFLLFLFFVPLRNPSSPAFPHLFSLTLTTVCRVCFLLLVFSLILFSHSPLYCLSSSVF